MTSDFDDLERQLHRIERKLAFIGDGVIGLCAIALGVAAYIGCQRTFGLSPDTSETIAFVTALAGLAYARNKFESE